MLGQVVQGKDGGVARLSSNGSCVVETSLYVIQLPQHLEVIASSQSLFKKTASVLSLITTLFTVQSPPILKLDTRKAFKLAMTATNHVSITNVMLHFG